MKNVNFVKVAKYVLIAMLIITVAGLVLLGVFGFNNSSEYKGGYEIVVEAEEVFGNLPEDMKDKAITLISSKGISYTSLKELDEGRKLIFSVDNKVSAETVEYIKGQLETVVKAPNSVSVTTNMVGVYEGNGNIWRAILVGGVLLVAAFVYMFFRYKLVAALTYLISCVAEVLFLIALTAASRVVVTGAYLTVVVGALALITLFANNFFGKVKEEIKNVNSKLTATEIANKATADSLIMMAISLIALVVISIMFIIIGSYTMFWTAIEIILCAITLFVTSAFITSGCYAFLKK